jgi:RNA polymerase sigma factor (sigma-70 family)
MRGRIPEVPRCGRAAQDRSHAITAPHRRWHRGSFESPAVPCACGARSPAGSKACAGDQQKRESTHGLARPRGGAQFKTVHGIGVAPSRFASHVLGYTGLVDPDDLVQQSAADVLARDIQLPPDERKAVAFIRCMIRYRARNVQRHIRAVASHETHLEELYREPVLADDVCEANEVAMVVRKTIESLPERTRLIVQLYRLRDLPAREVAGVLGVTESTVRELDRRGRRQLRSHLQRWREQNRGAE